ncbi:MAG: L,D-transpeptidase family protein [Kiloniellales bacterium]|nr:L,D-transpeptidase family protein [Kiloniellales bacterium]
MLFGSALRQLPGIGPPIAAAALLLLSCPSVLAEETPEASFAEELQRGLDRAAERAAGDRIAADLRAFYLDRDLAPVWVTEGGAGSRSAALTALLAAAEGDGLDPADYDLEAIRTLEPAREAAALARLELTLSRAFLRFLSDLGGGRAPDPTPTGAADQTAGRARIDAAALLEDAADADDLAQIVARARPQAPRYAALTEALLRYRRIADEGGWDAIRPGPPLRLGSIATRVPDLRRRLTLTGDLRPSARGASALYDQALAAAVRRAQQRHGLKPDGVVGPETLRVLNVPAAERVRQLALNLERLRWMPEDLGETFVYLNLAGPSLRLVEAGKTRLALRIAVGRPFRGTPVFSQALTSVVFSPDWTVPPGIVVSELLPVLQADPGYLARNGFTVFSDWGEEAKPLDPASIDWSAVDGAAGTYKLRQAPGPENPLGRISFVFPNDFGLCLHDTPINGTFEVGGAGFSLGCIRVEAPEELAAALLAEASGWSPERIAEVLAEGTPTAVGLPDPVPIHVTYLTAWTAGKAVHFRDDLFGRDAELAQALRAEP